MDDGEAEVGREEERQIVPATDHKKQNKAYDPAVVSVLPELRSLNLETRDEQYVEPKWA